MAARPDRGAAPRGRAAPPWTDPSSPMAGPLAGLLAAAVAGRPASAADLDGWIAWVDGLRPGADPFTWSAAAVAPGWRHADPLIGAAMACDDTARNLALVGGVADTDGRRRMRAAERIVAIAGAGVGRPGFSSPQVHLIRHAAHHLETWHPAHRSALLAAAVAHAGRGCPSVRYMAFSAASHMAKLLCSEGKSDLVPDGLARVAIARLRPGMASDGDGWHAAAVDLLGAMARTLHGHGPASLAPLIRATLAVRPHLADAFLPIAAASGRLDALAACSAT